MVGTTISHYKVLEKIGEGGMGEVYRAEDTNLSRDVAIKVLPEQFKSESKSQKRSKSMRKPIFSITVIFSISLAILGLNLAAGPIEGTASISGTVRDEKGSPFDGILVRLINTDRNVTVSVITQSGGLYAADSLFPGTYEVRAERRGWETAIKQGVRVVRRAAVDLVLIKQQVKPAHLTLEDLPGQFPEDPDRALVMNTCFQCHVRFFARALRQTLPHKPHPTCSSSLPTIAPFVISAVTVVRRTHQTLIGWQARGCDLRIASKRPRCVRQRGTISIRDSIR